MSNGWQPIETAPKDTDVLIYRIARYGPMIPIVAALFHNGEEAGWCTFDHDSDWIEGKPTHWMPLPPAPEAVA
jgi:hypothetical protein